jgi:outer membrane protein, multidrug efflux system
MTARAHAIVALALLGASGCMVGPNYVRPESPAPSDWGELASRDGEAKSVGSAPQPVAATWWTTFDDDRLRSLIERAMRANLDVRQAEARVSEARASRRIAASEFWPHVGASGSAIAERASKNSTGGSGDVSNHLYTVGFDASWEIDAFGGIRRSVELADASVAAAEAGRDDALVTLFGDVGLEYVTYRSLQHRIGIANDNLRSQQSTLDLTRRLFDAGLSPELDVQRAAAQVATTASAIPVLEFQAKQAMHALGVLLGEPPMALRDELGPVAPIPRAPAQVAVGLPSELLRRRPDIAISEHQLAAATAEIGVATADLFPRFILTGVGGLESIHASDLFEWGSRFGSIGPGVTWPVFQGGAIRANIALQNARQQELLAAYQSTVLRALQEVEDALVAFDHEQDTRARLEEAVSADQRAAELARSLYAQGLTDFLTVLVADETLFTAQDSLAQSERNVALQLIALYKALGGGWEVASAVPESAPIADHRGTGVAAE